MDDEYEVNIQGKVFQMKKIVAKYFLKNENKKRITKNIIHIDNNIENNNIINLRY